MLRLRRRSSMNYSACTNPRRRMVILAKLPGIKVKRGETRASARFGTCKISRQPNPDRLDFARWNYAEMLRNHARGSSAVARYCLLFITWLIRCSFTTYSGRRNCDNRYKGALFIQTSRIFSPFSSFARLKHCSLILLHVIPFFSTYLSWVARGRILRNNFKLLSTNFLF